MVYRALADLVLVLHLAFIVFVVAGGLLALRWRWAPLLQLPAACWGVFIEVSGGVCPLTPLENALRHSAGSSGYPGGFIEQYLVPVVYPSALSHPVQLGLAGMVVFVNTFVYLLVLRKYSRARNRGVQNKNNPHATIDAG
jgi:hypothetical protein